MPRALITGITGQDGQFLAELLHSQRLRGVRHDQGAEQPQGRPASRPSCRSWSWCRATCQDLPSLVAALEYTQPDEVYNLGGISFVPLSFRQAELTANVTGLGVLRMLEAIRMVGGSQDNPIRFYQASSSEMFGKVRETPQTELTPFHPRSPYGVRQGLRPPDHGELPRVVRPVRLQRHPVQPRERAAGARVRHPQGHQRRGPHQARPPGRSWCWACSTPSGTGATPATTSRPCGPCSSSPSPTTTWSPPARPTRCGSSSSWPSPPPTSTTGSATSARTSGSSARPRSICWWATPTKARDRLGWRPKVDFPSLVERMVRHDLKVESEKIARARR